MGPDLMARMQAHAERFGRVIFDHIHTPTCLAPFKLIGDSHHLRCAIIATGATAKYLASRPKRPSRAAVCPPAPPVTASSTATRTWSWSAVQHRRGRGPLPVNIARKVYLVHRDTLKAEKIMQDKLFAKVAAGKIETVWHHQVEEVGNDAGVTGVRVKSTLDGGTVTSTHGFFVAIGPSEYTAVRRPAGDEQRLPGDPLGPRRQRHPDLGGRRSCRRRADQHYRQAITSAGFGCMAALDAERYLDAQGKAS